MRTIKVGIVTTSVERRVDYHRVRNRCSMRDVVSTKDDGKSQRRVSFLEEDVLVLYRRGACYVYSKEDDVKLSPFTSYLRMRNL